MGIATVMSPLHAALHGSLCLSLQAVESLSGKSRRTLWRRLADGTLPRTGTDAQGRVTVPLHAVQADVTWPQTEADWTTVLAADAGDATAQCSVALQLMAADRWQAAQTWLEQAARHHQADAIHWLALCAFNGWGRAVNAEQGMVWLARAAALGHPVAHAQMAGLRPSRG